MIQENELRLGNLVWHKLNNKINMVRCSYQHFERLSKGEAASFFPVVLKAEILEKCGFRENKEYPLYPDAREFILVLPVSGNGDNEMYAYIKSNKECFGRVVVNKAVASNNFFHLHQLQNLYAALTGKELPVAL